MTNKNLPGMATATPGKHPPPATPEATSTDAAPYEVDPWLKAQETSSPKPPAQNPWNIVSKKRTHVDVTSDETQDPRVKETDHDAIKKRGETLTEHTTDKVTPIRVEFRLNNSTTQFNVRNALGNLLVKMQEGDKTVVLQSLQDTSQWASAEEMPIDEALTPHIVTRNESAPTQGNTITVYTKIRSSKTVSEIKFHQSTYHYLSTSKIFLRADRYQTEKTRSPGFFIKVHPRLIWKDSFKQSIQKALATMEADKTKKVITQYLDKINHTDDNLPLPEYHLHSSKRKFGPVTAEILSVTCAEHAAMYLKTILCKLSEQKKLPQGIFVPTGTQQLLGPATMVNLLRHHNIYIAKTTMVAIEGIDEEVMWESNIAITKSDSGTLEEKMKHDVPGIQSIEKTNSTATTGKWFIVIAKDSESKLHEYIDNKLPTIFSQITVADMHMNLNPPKRAGATKSAEVVGSYASVLKHIAKPLEPNSAARYDSTKVRPRKRPTVNTTTAAQPVQKQNSQWPSLQQATYLPSTTTAQVNNLNDMEQRIEKKLTTQLDTLKNQIKANQSQGHQSQSTQDSFTAPINLEERFKSLQADLESKLEAQVQNISCKLQSQIINQITTSFNTLTNTFEAKLEESLNQMINTISNQIAQTTNKKFAVQKPQTQLEDSSLTNFSESSDTEMSGARDP